MNAFCHGKTFLAWSSSSKEFTTPKKFFVYASLIKLNPSRTKGEKRKRRVEGEKKTGGKKKKKKKLK